MSERRCYTLRKVLAEVFVDEESDFDPGVAVMRRVILIQLLLFLYQIQESKCAKPDSKIGWK